MSSVITDYIDCPQCGYPAQKDEYYVVGEEKVICNHCGYSHVKSNDSETPHIYRGCGTIHYVSKDGKQDKLVRLRVPLSVVDRHKIYMDIQENYDTEKSSFYAWDDAKKSLDFLVGKKPQTLEEQYQEQSAEAEYYRQLAFNAPTQTDEYIGFDEA